MTYRVGRSAPAYNCPPLKTRQNAQRWLEWRAKQQGLPALSYCIWSEAEADGIIESKGGRKEVYYEDPRYPPGWAEEPEHNEYGEVSP